MSQRKLTYLNNNQIVFREGKIDFVSSYFDIDFALLLNESQIPIIIKGFIPINVTDKLDLRLIGNGRIIELIDINTPSTSHI